MTDTAPKMAWNPPSEEQLVADQIEFQQIYRDALRWRALMRCPQIKMQGSAGVDPHTGERTGGNVHFGAEFWPDPQGEDFRANNPKSAEHMDKSTAWGRACLVALADAIVEQEAKRDKEV